MNNQKRKARNPKPTIVVNMTEHLEKSQFQLTIILFLSSAVGLNFLLVSIIVDLCGCLGNYRNPITRPNQKLMLIAGAQLEK
jgi:hypothetical protein